MVKHHLPLIKILVLLALVVSGCNLPDAQCRLGRYPYRHNDHSAADHDHPQGS